MPAELDTSRSHCARADGPVAGAHLRAAAMPVPSRFRNDSACSASSGTRRSPVPASRTAGAAPPAARTRASSGAHWPEVPGVRRYVVLGLDHGAGTARAQLALDLRDPGHEQVHGGGQAGEAPRAVEGAVQLAERVRGPAPGAGQHRGLVQAPVTLGRASAPRRPSRLGSARRGWVGGPAHRPVRHQAQAHAPAVEGLHAVDRAEQVGVERRHGPGHDRLDEDLVDQLAGGRRRLPPAAQPVGLVRHRLEAPAVLQGVAQGGQVHRHGLEAALEHQRARHARVVLEVAGERTRSSAARRRRAAGSHGPGRRPGRCARPPRAAAASRPGCGACARGCAPARSRRRRPRRRGPPRRRRAPPRRPGTVRTAGGSRGPEGRPGGRRDPRPRRRRRPAPRR